MVTKSETDSSTLTKRTPISLGLVIALFVLAGGVFGFGIKGTIWAVRLETKVDSIESTVVEMGAKQDSFQTKNEDASYHDTLRIINPDMKFPNTEGAGQ